MFATGSAVLNERARPLLLKIGAGAERLPEACRIAGHTDAAPYAAATARTGSFRPSAPTPHGAVGGGRAAGGPRRSVTGVADRDPLLPADPLAAANRRIAIVVLRARRSVSPC